MKSPSLFRSSPHLRQNRAGVCGRKSLNQLRYPKSSIDISVILFRYWRNTQPISDSYLNETRLIPKHYPYDTLTILGRSCGEHNVVIEPVQERWLRCVQKPCFAGCKGNPSKAWGWPSPEKASVRGSDLGLLVSHKPPLNDASGAPAATPAPAPAPARGRCHGHGHDVAAGYSQASQVGQAMVLQSASSFLLLCGEKFHR